MTTVKEAHTGWVNSGRSGRGSTDVLLDAIVEHLLKADTVELRTKKKD